eukprot:scaffold89716_cov66-Phaeocystis_antarctica.AAC.1
MAATCPAFMITYMFLAESSRSSGNHKPRTTAECGPTHPARAELKPTQSSGGKDRTIRRRQPGLPSHRREPVGHRLPRLSQDAHELRRTLLGLGGREEGVGLAGGARASRAADAVDVLRGAARARREVEVDDALDAGHLCGKEGGSAFRQLSLRRLLSAPDYAPCCPELRPASVNQPVRPRWPAVPALVST